MKLLLITLLLLGLAIAGIAIKIWAKKDINYVTNTDNDLKDSPTEVYKIYTISREGEIGSKSFAEKTGQSIAGDKLIIASI